MKYIFIRCLLVMRKMLTSSVRSNLNTFLWLTIISSCSFLLALFWSPQTFVHMSVPTSDVPRPVAMQILNTNGDQRKLLLDRRDFVTIDRNADIEENRGRYAIDDLKKTKNLEKPEELNNVQGRSDMVKSFSLDTAQEAVENFVPSQHYIELPPVQKGGTQVRKPANAGEKNKEPSLSLPQKKVLAPPSPKTLENKTFSKNPGSSNVGSANKKETVVTNAFDITSMNNGDSISATKRILPNKSPSELIGCFNYLLKPHYAEIEAVRKKILSSPHNWVPYEPNNETRFVTYAENQTHFQDIAKYSNVKTLLFNVEPAKVMPCMINGGRLHYDYGINNCSRVLSTAKRHVMFGENLYDMTCVRDQKATLTSRPLTQAAYQVGLPAYYKHQPYKKTLFYLQVIQDATLTVYGDVTSGKLDIVTQRCFPNKRIYLPEDPTSLPLYKEVFSLSQYYGKGMFHANIEDISRIAPYISFLQSHPDIFIHVYDLGLPPVYLSMINIDPKRFINGTVRANVVYMPGGVNCCLPTLFQTQIESFYLRRNLPNPVGKARDTIIVVKRKHRRNRFFSNHEGIVKMVQSKAAPLGLKVWEFSDNPLPTLEETARKFNRAFLVIAPHGAGESNLIFTQPGTILLEGLCLDKHDGLVNVVFRTLSHILGGFYYGFYKPDAHCTETTADDLEPYLMFYLNRLEEFR